MNHFKYLYIALLLMVITSYNALAQNETVLKDTTNTGITEESQNLLPEKYLFTQRLLWGKKGAMRSFNIFKLSPESRDLEQEIRDKMFKAHRYIGYATLAGMVAQGIVGERLYRGNTGLKDLHEGLAGVVNIGYFTTAGLALFAPPRLNDRPKGFSTYKLHKYLVMVHLSSMIATNILSGMVEDNPSLKPYHRATAYVAYGSFFVSMVVINF
ncbi:MAG: hypothetical protein WC833_03910 [Bacteroidales bacterium]|jgi:hypothetical protein